jgi:hypothetical protein
LDVATHNISATSWRSALVLEEAGVPGENTDHGQTLSLEDASRVHPVCNLQKPGANPRRIGHRPHKNVKTLKFLLDAYSAVCVRLMYSLYMRHSIQGEAFNPFLHYFTHKDVKTLKFLMIAYSSLC